MQISHADPDGDLEYDYHSDDWPFYYNPHDDHLLIGDMGHYHIDMFRNSEHYKHKAERYLNDYNKPDWGFVGRISPSGSTSWYAGGYEHRDGVDAVLRKELGLPDPHEEADNFSDDEIWRTSNQQLPLGWPFAHGERVRSRLMGMEGTVTFVDQPGFRCLVLWDGKQEPSTVNAQSLQKTASSPVTHIPVDNVHASLGNHDSEYEQGQGIRTYPVLYNSETKNLYQTTQPGIYHADMIESHEGLSAEIGGYQNYFPAIDSGQWSAGRLQSNGHLQWYNHPHPQHQLEINNVLGIESSPALEQFSDDEIWGDEDTPQTPTAPRNSSVDWKQGNTLYEDFLKAANSEIKVIPCASRPQNPGMGYEKRLPFRYNPRKGVVFLGGPEMFHYQINEHPNWEGDGPADLKDGYVWTHTNTVDWYNHGPTMGDYEQEAVTRAVGNHLGVPLGPHQQDQYEDDSFWDEA